MKIGYNNKLISSAQSTIFLGLTICSTISWRMHIAHLPTKLSDACNAIRSIKPLMSHETLLLIYHSLFHTVMSYGIIFWGNSCHSMHIFQIQMRVIRIIRDCGNRDSCGILFKKTKNFTTYVTVYTSPTWFVVYNRDQFLIISEIHNTNTGHSSNFHVPSADLHIYQKRVYCSHIKIFSSLPFNINKFSDSREHLKVL